MSRGQIPCLRKNQRPSQESAALRRFSNRVLEAWQWLLHDIPSHVSDGEGKRRNGKIKRHWAYRLRRGTERKYAKGCGSLNELLALHAKSM